MGSIAPQIASGVSDGVIQIGSEGLHHKHLKSFIQGHRTHTFSLCFNSAADWPSPLAGASILWPWLQCPLEKLEKAPKNPPRSWSLDSLAIEPMAPVPRKQLEKAPPAQRPPQRPPKQRPHQSAPKTRKGPKPKGPRSC